MIEERLLLFHVSIFLPCLPRYPLIHYIYTLYILTELIGFYFKGGDEKFITVYVHGAKWAKERRSEVAVFNGNL